MNKDISESVSVKSDEGSVKCVVYIYYLIISLPIYKLQSSLHQYQAVPVYLVLVLKTKFGSNTRPAFYVRTSLQSDEKCREEKDDHTADSETV